MPADDETRLLVRIEAQLRQFERAMGQATRGADRAAGTIERRFKGMERTLAGIGKGLGPLLGVSLGVGAFKQLASAITATVSQADDLQDLADKIGITAENLQELQYQAKLNGSNTADLNTALDQFTKRIGEAASGSGALLKILTDHNIALRDQAGELRPITALLADYAELIRTAGSDAERLALAQAAFKNTDMASVFRNGAAGIAAASDEAHRFNQVVSNETTKALADIKPELDRLEGAWGVAWANITLLTLNALEKIGQAEHLILDPIIAFLKQGPSPAWQDYVKQQQQMRGIVPPVSPTTNPNANNRINGAFGTPPAATPAATFTPFDFSLLDKRFNSFGGGGGGGGGGGASRVIKEQRDSVADLVAELQRELSLVGETDVQQRISNELRQAGADATDAQKQQIADLVTKIDAEEQAQQGLIDRMDELRFASSSALDAFASSFQNGEGAAKGLKAALVDVLQTIIHIGEQKAIASLFGLPGTGGGGFFGGLIGKILPGLGGFGGASAALAGVGSMPTSAAASRGAAVVQVKVVPGQMFVPVVTGIAGQVSVQHSEAAENRAVGRAPAVARNNSRRFGTP